MKYFTFTIDDNIRFLKELTEKDYGSIFDHPYMAMLLSLHKTFDAAVQLNLFYRDGDFTGKDRDKVDLNKYFNLSMMTDRYKAEWKANSDWIKMSFHSDRNNVRPYLDSAYGEVFEDCRKVQDEIVRFAGEKSLARTTTVHYCACKNDLISAVKDCGVIGLLGLYGTDAEPRYSYDCSADAARKGRRGEIFSENGMFFAGIDIVLNMFDTEEIMRRLDALQDRDMIKVMIHEQFFYSDYSRYQPDFRQKIDRTFTFLLQHGYKSAFYEDLICGT